MKCGLSATGLLELGFTIGNSHFFGNGKKKKCLQFIYNQPEWSSLRLQEKSVFTAFLMEDYMWFKPLDNAILCTPKL